LEGESENIEDGDNDEERIVFGVDGNPNNRDHQYNTDAEIDNYPEV
jgi:hypothetical protein